MHTETPPVSFSDLFTDPDRLNRAIAIRPSVADLVSSYAPWRKVRYIARERKIEPVDAWSAVKWSRYHTVQHLPLKQKNGSPFSWCAGNQMLEPLHRVDRAAGGGGAAALESEQGTLFDEIHRTRLRIKTLMDEAAESSLIEGAATTRKEAVEMLRARRDPRTKGERMVLNNYIGMQRIKSWLSRPLEPQMLVELQGILTEGTLENPNESRRFRRSDENVRVVDAVTNEVIFTPPSAVGLEDRVQRLCDFANQDHTEGGFIHPIVKASILHFMVGYEHPFVDGNGRTARAVFYWHARRSGYNIFEYIPISEHIRKGPNRYVQAYLDCELDEGDLTYFILYALDIVEQSLDALAEHLRNEEAKVKRSERLLKLSKDLNLRQRLLLEHALRHPSTLYTVKSHMTSNGITPVTARADLEDIVRRRLMTTSKRAREVIYQVLPGLSERLARKGL